MLSVFNGLPDVKRVRECSSLLNHQGPFHSSVLCVVLFTQPWEGMLVGTRVLLFPLLFFGVSGMLAIDTYLNKKLFLNEIITASTGAL